MTNGEKILELHRQETRDMWLAIIIIIGLLIIMIVAYKIGFENSKNSVAQETLKEASIYQITTMKYL